MNGIVERDHVISINNINVKLVCDNMQHIHNMTCNNSDKRLTKGTLFTTHASICKYTKNMQLLTDIIKL